MTEVERMNYENCRNVAHGRQTNEFDPNEVDRFNAVDFIKVMEMVKKPLTNEEWFCRLSTEEKADLLSELVWWIHPSVQGGRKVELTKESFLRWLKEKHE